MLSLTAAIRRTVIGNREADAKTLQGLVVAQGFVDVKLTTIQTVRADTLATLREAAALGLVRSAEEQSPEPAARPRRSRSRRRSATIEEATA